MNYINNQNNRKRLVGLLEQSISRLAIISAKLNMHAALARLLDDTLVKHDRMDSPSHAIHHIRANLRCIEDLCNLALDKCAAAHSAANRESPISDYEEHVQNLKSSSIWITLGLTTAQTIEGQLKAVDCDIGKYSIYSSMGFLDSTTLILSSQIGTLQFDCQPICGALENIKTTLIEAIKEVESWQTKPHGAIVQPHA